MAQLLWNGLALGAFYGLVGIGLAITRGLWGILNLAQGDFMILGAYIVFILVNSLGLNLPCALVVSILLTGVLLALVARGTFHYTQRDLVNGFILSTGIGLIIQNCLELAMGSKAREVSVPNVGQLQILGTSIPIVRLIFFGVTILVIVGTNWFLGHSKMGRYIRAAALNNSAAKMMGINVDKVEFASYVISGILAAVAGIGLLIQFVVTPYLGARYALKGVAAMLLGGSYKGMGNIGATFVAGLMLGLVESIGGYYTAMQWQDIFAYILLYLGLIMASRMRKD